MKDRLALLIVVVVAVVMFTGCGDEAALNADAGPDFAVEVGQPPEFDGCGSTGDIEGYTWQIVEAPADMADDVGKFLRESGDDCSFVLESSMEIADEGTWIIELTVSNTDGATSTDQVAATVNP